MLRKATLLYRALERLRGERRTSGARRAKPGQSGLERLEGRALLTTSNAALANTLTHSAEYYQSVIIPDYQKFLGRSPVQSELNYWITQQQAGRSDESVLAGFAGSPEFYKTSGNTDASWITSMYQNILGRSPSTDEVNYYLNSLAGGNTRYNISYGFAASPEREGQVVTNDYTHFLDRAPFAGDVDYWVGKFSGGYSNENVIAGFVGSSEFYRLYVSADANFLIGAYKQTLGRAPLPNELSYNLNFLESTNLSSVSVPQTALYDVTITGTVNGVAFTQMGTLRVATAASLGIPADNNAMDFVIDSIGPNSSAQSGTLLFASNRALFSVLDPAAASLPLKLASTTVDPVGGTALINDDPTVVNTSNFQNVFKVVTNSGSTIDNLTGTAAANAIMLNFTTGGMTLSGSINLTGQAPGSTQTDTYTATISGSLRG